MNCFNKNDYINFVMSLYITHLFIFTIIYTLMILSDYINIKYLLFDFIWICASNFFLSLYIDNYFSIIFILLFTISYLLNLNIINFDTKINFAIILIQYGIIILFIFSTQILFIFILIELFNMLVFLLFLNSRFGYKILIIWYIYMFNLINFILLFILLYFYIISFCFYFNDLCFIIFDEEWLGILSIFSILFISFKLYSAFILLFMEQLYIRLGLFVFLYMLTFYILFCFLLLLIIINFTVYYIILIKIIIFQATICAIIGASTYAIMSLIFLLSVNNFCFLFLIFIASKNHLLLIFLNFHFFYSISLITILIIYNQFLVFNIFDIQYNENYFMSNYLFYSFFNNFIISILLSTILLSIGAIPIIFGFFLKVFNLFIYLSYTGVTIIFFCTFWLIAIYTFYFRLIINLFSFSYYSLGFWTIRYNSINNINIIWTLSFIIFAFFFDILNIFEIIF